MRHCNMKSQSVRSNLDFPSSNAAFHIVESAMAYNILIFGASYGSLLATKLLLAGHNVKLTCVPAEVELINKEGTRVRLPVKGREGLVEVDSRKLPGKLSADVPTAIKRPGYDLAVLAMQEPEYRSRGVRELLDVVAKAKLPCMSIMNMPPLPYLARVPGVSVDALKSCYTDPTVWASFDPKFMTLCSPDPQAFRPPEEKANVLQVRLPTNFKSARFPSDKHTAMLRKLEADIEAAIRERNMAADWTAKSLALHTQAVIQGAFILAKATGGAEIASDSIDHLRRCIEMLFGVGTEQAKHLTDGDSK